MHLEDSFETNQASPRTHCRGSVCNVGERPLEAPPVGQTCRPCACNVVRPLHAAIRNVENLEPRRHCRAGIPISVSHHSAERGSQRRDSTTREKRQIRRDSHGQLAEPPPTRIRVLLIRLKAACPIDLLLSPLRLNDELSPKYATRTRLTSCFWIQKRRRWLCANSVHRNEKAAHSGIGVTRFLRRQKCRSGSGCSPSPRSSVWQQLWTFVCCVVRSLFNVLE